MGSQTPPKELQAAGRRLWRSVLSSYELEAHEEGLLLQACRIADRLDGLAAVLAVEGVMEPGTGRAHPALVESRQQSIAYARVCAALRLPAGDAESDEARQDVRRPQRRVGARGVYGIAGGRSA